MNSSCQIIQHTIKFNFYVKLASKMRSLMLRKLYGSIMCFEHFARWSNVLYSCQKLRKSLVNLTYSNTTIPSVVVNSIASVRLGPIEAVSRKPKTVPLFNSPNLFVFFFSILRYLTGFLFYCRIFFFSVPNIRNQISHLKFS